MRQILRKIDEEQSSCVGRVRFMIVLAVHSSRALLDVRPQTLENICSPFQEDLQATLRLGVLSIQRSGNIVL